jgi:hypothetical protein
MSRRSQADTVDALTVLRGAFPPPSLHTVPDTGKWVRFRHDELYADVEIPPKYASFTRDDGLPDSTK